MPAPSTRRPADADTLCHAGLQASPLKLWVRYPAECHPIVVFSVRDPIGLRTSEPQSCGKARDVEKPRTRAVPVPMGRRGLSWRTDYGQTGVVSTITVSRVTVPKGALPISSQLPPCLRTSQRSSLPAAGLPCAEMLRVVPACELMLQVMASK